MTNPTAARSLRADTDTTCDHCRQPVHQDRNGYWVGKDETSDCPDNERGHMVNGNIR